MVKKILIFLVILFSNLYSILNIEASPVENELIRLSSNNVLDSESDDGFSLLAYIFWWVKESVTGLIFLIAVGVFLFIWIKLWLARWNPEEFKKAITQLVYAIVWIFIVSAAWAVVKLVSWLNF